MTFKPFYYLSLWLLSLTSFAQTDFRKITPKPPLGWNSYDSYHAAIIESQFKACVDVLATKLKPYGYDYATIDFCWYYPGPAGWTPEQWATFPLRQKRNKTGKLFPQVAMDSYGRLLPAENRFPSAKEGKGFKAIGDYTHSKGMKFAIHIMRGIPRQAVDENTPILGTKYHAKDIANPRDTCRWNNHMYGVDGSKPGAQEYYNSLFKLYAEWGVDFVKVDDISAPMYHAEEISMIRKAIDQCGRPMVLSLSCGETPLGNAAHVESTANMYRISKDFWDRWKDVAHMFDLLYAWQPLIGNNTWPDADMIPIGNLCIKGYPHEVGSPPPAGKEEHRSFLTPDEQKTLFTLWCMARSPLIWGGDPLSSSDEDFALLTNRDLLDINQNSTNNHQASHPTGGGLDLQDRIWVAESKDGKTKYLAFFNLSDQPKQMNFSFYWEYWRGNYQMTDLWTKADMGTVADQVQATVPPHGTVVYQLRSVK